MHKQWKPSTITGCLLLEHMHTAHIPPPSYYRHILQHSLHAFDHNHFTADLQILTLMPRLLLCFPATERKDESVRNFSNKVSQKQKKTNTWSVALSHRETGSDLWLRIMGRSVQPSALMHVCLHMCVCVCVMGVWVGVNVTANLLTFPKACISPPPERQTLTDAVMTMRHLCHCHPEGHTVGWKGGPALTCWPCAVWNTEPQMGSLTETNEIKKNKRRKEAQTKNRAIAAEGKFIVLCESVHSI